MSWKPTTEIEKIMFRPVDDEEEKEFREYARTHDPEPNTLAQWSICHPVFRDEWLKRGLAPKDLDTTEVPA